MEKKNIFIENNGSNLTMRYELLPTDELDEAALEKMKVSQLESAANLQYTVEDGRRLFYAYIPTGAQLSAYIKRHLSKAEVLSIVRSLATGMDIGKHNIPVSYIIKDMDYIYIDEQSRNLYLFILPIKGQNTDVSEVPDFLRNVISNMKFSDDDKDNYVARIITLINSERFSLSDLKVLANEMFIDLGEAAPAVPQGNVKVDKLGVMRNRNIPAQPQQIPPQMGQVPPMQPQMGQQPPMQPQMGQQPPVQPQMGQQPPVQPQMGQQSPVQPQMGQQPQQPQKRFDPMTGKPIEEAPQEVAPGPQKRFDPMTGRPLGAPAQPQQAPAGPTPQLQPIKKKFDPMTGEPIKDDIKPQAPVQQPGPQAPVQQPTPQAPIQQPTPQAPVQPGPQAPVQQPTPQAPVQQPAPSVPEAKKDDMVSIDDIMGMEQESEEAKTDTLKPHFVRQKTGEKIYISKDEFKIGKSKVHSDYSIENNSAISRVHVIVISRDGEYYLKDNESTNGTYVDGDRLEAGREVQLKSNMIIKFGDEDFEFFLTEGAN